MKKFIYINGGYMVFGLAILLTVLWILFFPQLRWSDLTTFKFKF